MTLLFYQLLILMAILLRVSIVRSQECPDISNESAPLCKSIWDWYDLVNVVKMAKSNESKLLCEFDIQMPNAANSLILAKPVTLICVKAEKCIIRSAENNDKSLLKMRGLARVTLYGFTFLSSGAMCDRSSAVHITFRSSMKQTICNCVFNGFKGKIRGTALRSEPGTQVDLVGCTFSDNASNDLGSIFNRGSMMVKGCAFIDNLGRGGGIGSSIGSMTILQGNSFVNNRNSMPVFFHDSNYIDKGGNIALNNESCDGIFVQRSLQCLSFDKSQLASSSPTKYDSSLHTVRPSGAVAENENSCSHIGSDEISPCVSVASFQDLKNQIQIAEGTVIFCPFKITKRSDESLDIFHRVQITCLVIGECHIIGQGNHARILGPSAEVFFQGFIFEGATEGAVHILSTASLQQCFAQCHFEGNHGEGRGIGLLAERKTRVQVRSCTFTGNKSSDLGGALFNRGEMVIIDSLFQDNEGRGGAIGNAPRAPLEMKNNTFMNNSLGYPVFLHDFSLTDHGGNVAHENSGCNGVWIDRGLRSCIPFLYNSVTATNVTAVETAPVGGIEYFNYNESDKMYGPTNWGRVRNNAEYLRYNELKGTLKRSLVNKCNRKSVSQSPIDLCDDKINNECYEHHQTRSHSGNINLGDREHVTAQILPSKLRLKYYPDRPPAEGPYPPELDYANNWNGYAEVNHIDIKIPSEHTICGQHYPAEYSVYVLHPLRRQTIVMSIFLDHNEDDEDNDHLQLAINEWQNEYDRNTSRCNKTKFQKRKLAAKSNLLFSKALNTTFEHQHERVLPDKTPFGRGGWDPFHPSLERSIYHWGYSGTLTEPPCSSFVSWRVLTEPAFISRRQLSQMKKILFTNQDEDCNYTTVNFEESVARPTQPNRGRSLHKCTAKDYVSDREKAAMREKTGNPNWCC